MPPNRLYEKFKLNSNDFNLSIWWYKIEHPKGYKYILSDTDQYLKNINEKVEKKVSQFLNNNKSDLNIGTLNNILHNCFDSCKQKFLEKNNFIWEIIINTIINYKRKVITIIIRDNWAWKKALKSQDKIISHEYMWWAWKWEDYIRDDSKSYRLIQDINRATTIVQFLIND